MEKITMREFVLTLLISLIAAATASAQQPAQLQNDMLNLAINTGSDEDLQQLRQKLAGVEEPELFLGIAYHNLGQLDFNYIGMSISNLQTAWNAKKNSLALGYLGSAITLRAGKAAAEGNLIAAIADLSEGTKKMDDAVASDPENQALRTLRLVNGINLSLSSPMPRDEAIKEDLAYFKTNLVQLDKNMKALYWYCSGNYALYQERWNDAFADLEQAVKSSPGSQYAKLADDLLWELEE